MKKISNELSKTELRKLFLRSLSIEGSFNYERMMSLGYSYSMLPTIERVYETEEEKIAAVKRHLEFFNCTAAMSPFIMGVTVAMEEENKKSDNFDDSSINSMKAGLMGPLSGIGDAIFWGSLRVISAGIGISLALSGNVLGPILFLLVYNIPNILVRYFGIKLGYKFGFSLIDKLASSGTMERVTYLINIIGMIVIGAMVSQMVYINMPIVISGTAEDPYTLQMVFDSIMPNILPVGLTYLFSVLLRKKKVKVSVLIVLVLVVGILGAATGILSA